MAARASARISQDPRPREPEGFKDFEEAFFCAGEVIESRRASAPPAVSKWRRALARAVALTIFSAALVMAWKAFGSTLRDEASIRTQLRTTAIRAQVVGDRAAWAAPVTTERSATPRQRPHSTTAARNRRR